MLELNAIIGIVGSSVGLIVTLVGLAGRSVAVHRSRKHILDVQNQKRILRHKLRKAEYGLGSLNEIDTQGVYDFRRETQNLIRHSRRQIKDFERFHNKFIASRTVRGWNYIAISAGSDRILKYAKRFETYSDWITIALLSISLTLTIDRDSLRGNVSSSCWKDVNHLRDELGRVKRAKITHPGRLMKLHVNKGVDLEKLEEYAGSLVSKFPITNDQIRDLLRVPPSMFTSATKSRPDTGRGRDDRRSKHSRNQNGTAMVRPESSGSRRSLTPTPFPEHDGEWNTAPISQGGRRRQRERYRHNISSDQAYTMTSGLGRSESAERSRHSRPRRQSGSLSNETRTRSRSYHPKQGGDQEIRGRDAHKRSFQDTQHNPSSPSRYRSQSRSSHSSRHTGAGQEQQRRDNMAIIEIRPPTSRHYSTSSSANVSPRPSHDSGYSSLRPERHSSNASVASTRRRSSSRPHGRQQSQFDDGDRSRPPIALDRAEERIKRAKERTRNSKHGSR